MPDIKKSIKYKEYQNEIFKKLLDIIKCDTLILYDIDNNIEIQNKIIDLSIDIKKIFPCSSITGINKKTCKRPYMSIIRYLMKYYNFDIIISDYTLLKFNKKIRTKKYKFVKE